MNTTKYAFDSRGRNRVFAILAVAVLSVLSPGAAWASTNIVSAPVCAVSLTVPPETDLGAGMGLEPFDPSVNALFLGRMTGGTNEAAADRLRQFDLLGQAYTNAYAWTNGSWYVDLSGLALSPMAFPAGAGFFIRNSQTVTQRCVIAGKVALANVATQTVASGLTFLGYPFTTARKLNDMAFSTSGATASTAPTNADQISVWDPASSNWVSFGLKSPDNAWFLTADWSGSPTTARVNLAKGFWYNTTNGFCWTESRPYANPFPANANPPVVTNMTVNAAQDEVTLGIDATGISTLEIYYKDAAASDEFAATNGWQVALTNLAGNGAVAWTDDGAHTGVKVSAVHARYYLVANAGVDTDGDGQPDAREIYVLGTDPAQAPPHSLAGTVQYYGSQTGAVRVLACAASNEWTSAFSCVLDAPGAFTITNVPAGSNYWVKAYRDSNGDGACDATEAYGVCDQNPVVSTQDVSGLTVLLLDPGTEADGIWANIGGGVYTNAANWVANRPPQSPGGKATFPSNASYTVSFPASVTNQAAVFKAAGGTVTLDIGGGTNAAYTNIWTLTNSFSMGTNAGSFATVAVTSGALRVSSGVMNLGNGVLTNSGSGVAEVGTPGVTANSALYVPANMTCTVNQVTFRGVSNNVTWTIGGPGTLVVNKSFLAPEFPSGKTYVNETLQITNGTVRAGGVNAFSVPPVGYGGNTYFTVNNAVLDMAGYNQPLYYTERITIGANATLKNSGANATWQEAGTYGSYFYVYGTVADGTPGDGAASGVISFRTYYYVTFYHGGHTLNNLLDRNGAGGGFYTLYSTNSTDHNTIYGIPVAASISAYFHADNAGNISRTLGGKEADGTTDRFVTIGGGLNLYITNAVNISNGSYTNNNDVASGSSIVLSRYGTTSTNVTYTMRNLTNGLTATTTNGAFKLRFQGTNTLTASSTHTVTGTLLVNRIAESGGQRALTKAGTGTLELYGTGLFSTNRLTAGTLLVSGAVTNRYLELWSNTVLSVADTGYLKVTNTLVNTNGASTVKFTASSNAIGRIDVAGVWSNSATAKLVVDMTAYAWPAGSPVTLATFASMPTPYAASNITVMGSVMVVQSATDIVAVVASSCLPWVTNGGSTVHPSSVDVSGTLVTNGGFDTRVYLFCAPSDGGTNEAAWTPVTNFGPVASGAAFTNAIANLQPESAYYWTHMASNAAGKTWAASSCSFLTAPRDGIWANTSGGVYTNAANWLDTLPPSSPGGKATFPSNADYTVSFPASASNNAADFTAAGGTVTLDIGAGNLWTLTNALSMGTNAGAFATVSVTSGTLRASAGTMLLGNGVLTNSGSGVVELGNTSANVTPSLYVPSNSTCTVNQLTIRRTGAVDTTWYYGGPGALVINSPFSLPELGAVGSQFGVNTCFTITNGTVKAGSVDAFAWGGGNATYASLYVQDNAVLDMNGYSQTMIARQIPFIYGRLINSGANAEWTVGSSGSDMLVYGSVEDGTPGDGPATGLVTLSVPQSNSLHLCRGGQTVNTITGGGNGESVYLCSANATDHNTIYGAVNPANTYAFLYADNAGQISRTLGGKEADGTTDRFVTLGGGLNLYITNAVNISNGSYTNNNDFAGGALTLSRTDTSSTNVTYAMRNLANGLTAVTTNGAFRLLFYGTNTLSSDSTHDVTGTLLLNRIVETGGAKSLTKDGPGALVLLSGDSIHAGPTVAKAGSLVLADPHAAGTGTLTMDGGTLLFDQSSPGSAFTLGGLAASAAGSGWDIVLQNDAGSPVSLIVGGNNADTTYSGVFSGSGNLVKEGTGKLTLAAANVFTGPTIVSNGVLSLAAKWCLFASESLSVQPGATCRVEQVTWGHGGDRVVHYVDNGKRYIAHIFTNSAAAANFTVDSLGVVDVLVVAGGGGAGGEAGGGGAGGLIYSNSYPVVAGSNYAVTVGIGGVAGYYGTGGGNGSNTSFAALVAFGGGGGGGNGDPAAVKGGGSGGGGGYNWGVNGPGGSGTNGQGNAGGAGYGTWQFGAGGGGGAATNGNPGTSPKGGNGGMGRCIDAFTNTALAVGSPAGWFAGGGGGGSGWEASDHAHGGMGGGGDAGLQHAMNPGSNGVANTGGGGGGASAGFHGYPASGNGGSGIVIVRYRDQALKCGKALRLHSAGAVYGKMDLGPAGTLSCVHAMSFDGASQSPGTWGASGSGAQYTNDDFFAGSGVLTVGGNDLMIDNTSATALASGEAWLGGLLLSSGPVPLHVWMYWGTNDCGTNVWPNSVDLGVCAQGALTAHVTGLNCTNTTYYYRYFVSNSDDIGWADPATSFGGAADTDDDAMPDGWELAHGLDPLVSDAHLDPDNDGLASLQEYQIGTHPSNADTDNDGVSDGDEVMVFGTSPTVVQFDGTVTNAVTLNGSATNAAMGSWSVEGSEILCNDARGYVEYAINLSADDIYRLRVEATHVAIISQCSPVTPIGESDLVFYLDGLRLGKKTLTAPDGVYSTAEILTPRVQAGAHTVRVYWENVHSRVKLKIRKLWADRLGGADSNSNGVKDWVEESVAGFSSVEGVWTNANPSSAVSPVCLEGASRYVDLMAMTVAGASNAVCHGVGDRWYANVSLSSTAATPVTISYQGGALTLSNSIIWSALNLLGAQDLRIRKNDTVMFTAYPDGATNGTVVIGIAGVTNYSTTVDQPLVHTFTNAGEYVVTGSYEGGVTNTNSITVTVMEASFPTNPPAALLGSTRFYECPDIPSNAVLEADDTVTVQKSGNGINLTMANISGDHYLLARVSTNGPILASTKLNGFWVQSAVDSHMWVVERYPTYQVWENTLFAKNLPAGVDIKISIFISGVTFDDSTTVRWISAADLNALGAYTWRMIHPNSVTASSCHTITLYQNGVYLGECYYSSNMPEE